MKQNEIGFLNQKFSVFCGAGVSRNSGLPVVKDIVKAFLINLPLPQKNIDNVLKQFLTKQKKPFESFLERIISISKDDSFLHMFGEGESNLNHILLAELAKNNYLDYIFTTNFDILFEKAFEQVGLIKDMDYYVIDDENQFDIIPKNKTLLVKLHGSIREDRNTNTIRATISQIARKDLSMKRRKLIRNIFFSKKYEHLLIMGYSFSDFFDINPEIENVKNPRVKIIWLDHKKYSYNPVNIRNKSGNNPFCKGGFAGEYIRINTDKFSHMLLEHFKINTPQKKFNNFANWEMYIEKWASNLNIGMKYYICGIIHEMISDYQGALEFYKIARRKTNIRQNNLLYCNILLSMGIAHQHQCNYKKARHFYMTAIRNAKDSKEETLSKSFYQLGRVFEEKGQYDSALEHYNKSLDIDYILKDQKGLATLYHQIGMIYHHQKRDFAAAKIYYKRSIKIKEDFGYLEGIVNTLHQIATLHYENNKLDAAHKHYERAEKLARQLGDKKGLGRIYYQMGMVYQEKRLFDKAYKYYRKALAIKKATTDPKGIARYYHQMAVLYSEKQDFSKAINAIMKAIRIKDKIGDEIGLALDYHQLAIIQKEKKNYKEALQSARKASRIYKKRGYVKEEEEINELLNFLRTSSLVNKS